MEKPPKQKVIVFSIALSPKTREELEKLCVSYKENMSRVLTRLINKAYLELNGKNVWPE